MRSAANPVRSALPATSHRDALAASDTLEVIRHHLRAVVALRRMEVEELGDHGVERRRNGVPQARDRQRLARCDPVDQGGTDPVREWPLTGQHLVEYGT